ncbi:GNAT family N-acetyltransferase [Sagittula sp. S175]|uniref:GNAT family N-acetyltransferase n=1 Tax=Sagittula sp. S175 TaxID=3415129 RepID=UPI003C7A0702
MIRRATPADATRIRAITESAYSKYIPRIGRRPAPMDVDVDAQIAEGLLWVWDAGGILGAVVFYPEGEAMHLNALAVAPEATGQGLGRKLIAFVESEARRAGLSKVALYTNAKMTENLAMYPYLGFTEINRRTEDGFDRVFYEKPV